MFWSELDILKDGDSTHVLVTNLVWSIDASAWNKKRFSFHFIKEQKTYFVFWTTFLILRMKCIVNFHDDAIFVQFIRNILVQ